VALAASRDVGSATSAEAQPPTIVASDISEHSANAAFRSEKCTDITSYCSELAVTPEQIRALHDYWMTQEHWLRCLIQGCLYSATSDTCQFCGAERPKHVATIFGMSVLTDARLKADEAYLKDHRGVMHPLTSPKNDH
jgi:hypothetical protein